MIWELLFFIWIRNSALNPYEVFLLYRTMYCHGTSRKARNKLFPLLYKGVVLYKEVMIMVTVVFVQHIDDSACALTPFAQMIESTPSV